MGKECRLARSVGVGIDKSAARGMLHRSADEWCLLVCDQSRKRVACHCATSGDGGTAARLVGE
eukprot:412023-Prymnesium_polylepis.1